jgi:predicted MPP superfamily phosphohydrolase
LPYNKVFVSVFLFTILIFIYGYFEANNISIKHIYLNSYKLNRTIKIVFLSDIHLGITSLKERVHKLIKQLKKIDPDILILGGDFVDGRHNNIDEYVNYFKNIHIRYGKYAILGNHEYYAGRNYSEKIIKKAGFILLNNESFVIRDLNISITGIEDIERDQVKELDLLKNNYNNNFFNIYVKHRPVINPNVLDYIDLQLSGHTHNGQIFPFGLLIKLFYKYTSGLYKLKDNSFIYVSNGVFTWGPPIRVLAKPEISLITINKE